MENQLKHRLWVEQRVRARDGSQVAGIDELAAQAESADLLDAAVTEEEIALGLVDLAGPSRGGRMNP